MKRILLTVSILSATICGSVAQVIDAESAKNHVIVKYSPATMFDFDNTVQFGVEVPLGKGDFTIQQDLGYGTSAFNLWYYDEDPSPDKRTFKSRTQFRFYYFERRRMRGYVGPELLLKSVVYRENQWAGMECVSGNCGYFQQHQVKMAKQAVAVHARVGWQFYFTNRMALDLFTGIGFRSITGKSLTPENGNRQIYAIDDIWTSVSPRTREFVPSVALGVHFGIVLGKFKD